MWSSQIHRAGSYLKLGVSANGVAMSTGFGPLHMNQFAEALGRATQQEFSMETLIVVVRRSDEAEQIRDTLQLWENRHKS